MLSGVEASGGGRVRQSITYALEKGFRIKKNIESLVWQICYRAADFAYLLELEGKNISEYSEYLRGWDENGESIMVDDEDDEGE